MKTIIDGKLYEIDVEKPIIYNMDWNANKKYYKTQGKYLCYIEATNFFYMVTKEQLKEAFEGRNLKDDDQVKFYEKEFGINLLEKESFYKEVKRRGE